MSTSSAGYPQTNNRRAIAFTKRARAQYKTFKITPLFTVNDNTIFRVISLDEDVEARITLMKYHDWKTFDKILAKTITRLQNPLQTYECPICFEECLVGVFCNVCFNQICPDCNQKLGRHCVICPLCRAEHRL